MKRNCRKCGIEFDKKGCPACARVRQAAYIAANPDVERVWRAANPGKVKGYGRSWDAKNPGKRKEFCRKWREDNPGVICASIARNRAAGLKAMPEWADEFIISEAYELAALRSKATGVKWNVDHIVPLKSDLVCGLHCEFNIQLLTHRENSLKGNWRWPGMPTEENKCEVIL